MSLLTSQIEKDAYGNITSEISKYQPTDLEKERVCLVKDDFQTGDQIMQLPRKEFNDESLLDRISIDRAEWNTYQPNDGDSYDGDEMYSWKSHAIRPIVRNRAMSIAAHATARVLYPKVFAINRQGEEDKAAAQVMRDLMEWRAYRYQYPWTFLHMVLTALVDPVAIMHTEYCETYRTVKDENGKEKEILDENLSGFMDTVVPCEEFYIENAYESDIQKQGFVMWRKVISYSLAKTKYEKKYENFEYVLPGVQVLYNDANQTFYNVYDSSLEGGMVEEIIYWNRNLDIKLTVVNGVMLTGADDANPRRDKQYPFVSMKYEEIDPTGHFFYGKSLVFKVLPDARIINDLYPMIIDGVKLGLFPPVYVTGGEDIGGDVIIPGSMHVLSDKDSEMKTLNPAGNFFNGIQALLDAEKSLNQGSVDPLLSGQQPKGETTAYEINRIENNAATVLGIFQKMISKGVIDFGNLVISDTLQYMTVGELTKIVAGDRVIQKFIIPNRKTANGMGSKLIEFDMEMPSEETMDGGELETLSMELFERELEKKENLEIVKVNPELFRNQKYMLLVSADTLMPITEEMERAFALEFFNKTANDPYLDPIAIRKDFLLSQYPVSRDNPDKYIRQQPAMQPEQSGKQGARGMDATDIMAQAKETAGAGIPQPPKTPQ